MTKINKPNSDTEILEVMKSYCQDKGYTFSDSQLDYMAQSCFLHFESRGWVSIKYWPAVAKRWCLNNLDKQIKCNYKPKGKSTREKIMERETRQEDGKE